jgi:hypothetical protein
MGESETSGLTDTEKLDYVYEFCKKLEGLLDGLAPMMNMMGMPGMPIPLPSGANPDDLLKMLQ